MRILYIGSVDLDRGRADAVHFAGLAKALRASGHTLSVIAFGRDEGPHIGDAELLQVPRSAYAKIGTPLDDCALGIAAAKAAVLRHYDIAYHRSVAAVGIVAPLLGIPAIVEVNGIQADEFRSAGMSRLGMWLYQLRERVSIRTADSIVCVTEGIRDRLVQYYGAKPEKCRIIPNATDVEHFRPLSKQVCQSRVGLVAEDFNVGFVGSFQPWVDFETLLDATAALQSFGIPVRVTLVGDGILQQDVQRQIEKRSIGSAVRLVGRVPHEEVRTWIGAFDVCVEPSGQAYVQEIGKSSMKLFEYMACGRPVVATALPGNEQTIAAAQCGFLYEPGDHRALTHHLLWLSERPNEQDRAGIRGRAYAVQNHSWASVAQRLETVMDELVQRHAAK